LETLTTNRSKEGHATYSELLNVLSTMMYFLFKFEYAETARITPTMKKADAVKSRNWVVIIGKQIVINNPRAMPSNPVPIAYTVTLLIGLGSKISSITFLVPIIMLPEMI
tara:strand:- start:14383 stop:14712 length:330 start_codon:yes stop_codon:yes gene_type:complete